MVRLGRLLDGWPAGRHLLFCDESAPAGPLPVIPPPAAILIGPEGGFSPDERTRLCAHPAARRVALGPRILRAETAAVAALALWQARAGDWT
jgi:16S rRNA (uracil1498-N3)-methyltransferase